MTGRGPNLWGSARSAAGSRFSRFLRRRLIPIVVVAAVLFGLFIATTGASLPDDGEPIAVSPDAALAFARKVTDAAGDATSSRAIAITVTEQEVTSFLAIASLLSGELEDAGGTGDLSELASLGGDVGGGDIGSVDNWKTLVASQGGVGSVLTRGLDLRVAIREPEVRFTSDGEVIIRGFGKVAFISVPARLVVKPQIIDGEVDFELVEGTFGRLPLPGAMANLAESAIERALLAGYDIASVDQITVTDGKLTFKGSLQR